MHMGKRKPYLITFQSTHLIKQRILLFPPYTYQLLIYSSITSAWAIERMSSTKTIPSPGFPFT